MRIFVLYKADFGKKVIGNLINLRTFCQSCGDYCTGCRDFRKSFASNIHGVYEFPDNLPNFIEEPEKYLPKTMPECDLIIVIGIHPDLLFALPAIVKKTKAKGVIVPIEDPKWVQSGLQHQIKDKLKKRGVDIVFPKPFCSLTECGNPVIDEFISYGFGKPKMEIELRGDTIVNARVIRDAPCGSTWFVAQKLKNTNIKDFKETVSSSHHSYPCTASMDRDVQLKDTILHKAGYIIRDAVEEGIKKGLDKSKQKQHKY